MELFLSYNHQSSQRLPSHSGACDEHRRMRQENPKPQCHIEGFAVTPGRPSRVAGNFLGTPSRRACRRKERVGTVWDTHCSERGSQVHPDIQYGRYDRFRQPTINPGGKHARLFSSYVEECPQRLIGPRIRVARPERGPAMSCVRRLPKTRSVAIFWFLF